MAAPRAGRREWIGLGVIALPCLLYSMDLTVLNLAVPHLSADLTPTSAQLLWIVDIYGFLVAGSLITMGTLGDRIGRRRLLLIGAAAFGLASVLAAFSTSPRMLIAARAILGVAGATLAPSTLSLIRNMFHDAHQRTVAIGVWITSYSVGAAIGPMIGGVMLEYFWWGSVFLIGVPVMGLLLAVGPSLLPEYRDPGAGRLDLTSALLSLVAVLAVIWGLKEIAQDGASWPPLGSIALGFALGLAFVRRQQTLADPLIDLQFFRMPRFSGSLAMYLLATFVAFASYVFIAQYLQLVLGLSPLVAGLWTLPWALGFVAGSQLTPHLVRRMSPRTLMMIGSAVGAVGMGLFGFITERTAFALIVTGSTLFSLGLAPVFTLATDVIVSAAPPERAGAAAALSETSSELGGALGIALLGSIGIAIYRSGMASALPPGLDREAVAAARGTLGGALAVADALGSGSGAELAEQARAVFTRAVRITSLVCASLAAVIAVTIGALMERDQARPGPAAV